MSVREVRGLIVRAWSMGRETPPIGVKLRVIVDYGLQKTILTVAGFVAFALSMAIELL
jgi:hypothetical protein